MPVTNAQLRKAYELGADAARAVASWITDGNDTDESRRAKLQTIEDDGADEIMRRPNLSGEFADDPTPLSLARDILPPDTPLASDDVDALADAYERGVDVAFEDACIAELRAYLD